MILKTPFTDTEKHSFEFSSDYALALTFFSKQDKNKTSMFDLERIMCIYKVNNKYDLAIFDKYIMNANYTSLTQNEIYLIKQLMQLHQNDFDLYNSYEFCIHNMQFLGIDSNKLLKFAYCVDLIYYFNLNRNNKILETCIKYIYKNNEDFSFYNRYKAFYKTINSIHRDYYEDILAYYFSDNDLINILQLLEIDTVADMFKYDKEVLYIIFARDIEKYISLFKEMSNRKKDSIFELLVLIDKIRQSIFKKPNHKDVFYKRYGILTERHTLEEIGIGFNCTRERIRQIEKKIVDTIKLSYKKSIVDAINKAIKLQKIKDDYLEYDAVETFIGDREITALLRVLIEIVDIDICFAPNLNIFYYKNKIESIIENKLISLPIFITNDETTSYDIIDYNIITNSTYYKKMRNKGYLRSNYYPKDLYSHVIDELYPEGFKQNDEFANEVNKVMYERFEIEPINIRALFGLISRCDYCYIDSGTLINRKFTVLLEEELQKEILTYIYNCELDVIYYTNIFKKFELELKKLGINNRYYLKGLLDPILPESYLHQRDYISLGSNQITGSEAINDFISSIEGVISIELVKNKFFGVADYIIYNQLSQRDDLLADENSKFIKMEHINIFKGFEVFVKHELEKLFNRFETSVITSTKIYSHLKINYLDVMERLPYLDNHYIFFSYLKKIFSNDYNFRRPYISKDKTIDLNINSIIRKYIDSLDYFNNKIINSFCIKMHLRGLYSYLDFMIEVSDKFIQIDMENCIKKEKIRISNLQLEKILYEIDFYINSFGSINTEKSINFDYYPYFGYRWSKYLLVGIIRCYFNNIYNIEYTNTAYNKTDYIIRRNINERKY